MPPAVAAPEGCDDLVKLRRKALSGKLDPESAACLQRRLFDPSDADRLTVSTVLISDAHVRGDDEGWAVLVTYHLGTLDHTDAELAAAWAERLSADPSRLEESIRWAEVALEHAWRLPEETAADRLVSIHALRARASESLWKAAELTADDDDASRFAAATRRTRTRLYAIEWLRQARAVKRDPTAARELCVETGWSNEQCDAAADRPAE